MATGTTEFIDVTTADVFIPEWWSMFFIPAREQKLLFAALVDRKFEQDLSSGDLIHVPSRTHLNARTKSKNTAITYETQTETNTDISIATHQYAAIAVEDIAKVQTNREQLAYYAGELGYAVGIAVDDNLAGLPDDLTQTVGVFGADSPDEDYLRAIQYLDDANAPDTERYFVMSPAARSALMLLEHFISADYTSIHGTPAVTDLQSGLVGSYFGYPIYRTTNVEGSNAAGHDNAYFQRQTFALVMQMQPTMHHMFDIDFIADKVAVAQLYGFKEIRPDHGTWMQGP